MKGRRGQGKDKPGRAAEAVPWHRSRRLTPTNGDVESSGASGPMPRTKRAAFEPSPLEAEGGNRPVSEGTVDPRKLRKSGPVGFSCAGERTDGTTRDGAVVTGHAVASRITRRPKGQTDEQY
jgi:hypothetical protein